MSRSRKKVPIIGIATHKRDTHRFYKKAMTRRCRRWLGSIEELVSGALYKKLEHSWHWRPDDGKQFYENEKSYRK
jgi:hypothetical protein